MPKLKSRSKRVGRSRKSRTSARKYVSKEERGLGECRGKKKNVCKSDPNCSYRKKIGCVRKRGSKGEPLVYGPALPNAKYKRRVGRPSGRRSKSRSRKRVGRPRNSKSKNKSKVPVLPITSTEHINSELESVLRLRIHLVIELDELVILLLFVFILFDVSNRE